MTFYLRDCDCSNPTLVSGVAETRCLSPTSWAGITEALDLGGLTSALELLNFTDWCVEHTPGDPEADWCKSPNTAQPLEIRVTGPGIWSFRWKCSCRSGYDRLRFFVDGQLQAEITGEQDWQAVQGQITNSGLHVLRWQYVKGGSGSSGKDCGWVDSVAWSPSQTGSWPNMARALDTQLDFTTGGDASWFTLNWAEAYDGDCASSGTVEDNQQSWLETTVQGPGTIRFSWKVSSEANWDWLEFYVDGSRKDRISGSTGWRSCQFLVTGTGAHVLRWRYVKDSSVSIGEDRGWLDRVVWEPSVPPPAGGNAPPVVNGVPSGVSIGEAGRAYSFTIAAIDPDGDKVSYTFDWGDGTSTTIGESLGVFIGYPSGYVASCSHTWNLANTYQVRVRAKDSRGAFSQWSLAHTVLITPVASVGLDEGIDLDEGSIGGTLVYWETGGASSWHGVTGLGYYDGDYIRSGPVAFGQESWIRAGVETWMGNLGCVCFRWGVVGSGYLDVYVDGVLWGQVRNGESGWTWVYAYGSSHMPWIEWRFSYGTGYGWVDQVEVFSQ